MEPGSRSESTKVIRFSSVLGWWIEAHRPAVLPASPCGPQAAGVARRSQPAQNRSSAGSAGSSNSTSVKSEQSPASVQVSGVNGSRVPAR